MKYIHSKKKILLNWSNTLHIEMSLNSRGYQFMKLSVFGSIKHPSSFKPNFYYLGAALSSQKPVTYSLPAL